MEKNVKNIFTISGIIIVGIIVIIGLISSFPSAERESKRIVKHANPSGKWEVVDTRTFDARKFVFLYEKNTFL